MKTLIETFRENKLIRSRGGIPVLAENEDRIVARLALVNGTAFRHSFSKFSQIADLVDVAEHRLACLSLPKSYRAGAHLIAQSGSWLSNAYGHAANTTTVMLRRGSKHWLLVEVERSQLWPGNNPRFAIQISPKQGAWAAATRERKYSIMIADLSSTPVGN